MLRPTPLRRYLGVMKAKGYSSEQVVAGTGVEASQLDDPLYLIEASQYQQIIQNMVTLTGGEGLGLDIGLERDAKDFGILGYAALSCRTIRQAVEEFWGGKGGYGDAMGMVARIVIPRDTSDTITVDVAVSATSPLVERFLVEEALCLLLKVGSQVCGSEPHFTKLEFSYPRPAYSERYQQLFHCPLVFKATRTRASFDRAWFESPLQTSDPELIQLYRQRLTEMCEQITHRQPLGARLHSLFQQRRSVPSLDAAARELGLSPRTLRRQLLQEQQSYRKLAMEYRLERALELVKTGTIAAKQISEEAGFSDVNAFRRAFKTWTGKTVRRYRSEQDTAPDTPHYRSNNAP